MTNTNSALCKTLNHVIGAERTNNLFQVLTIPRGILNEIGDTISRADVIDRVAQGTPSQHGSSTRTGVRKVEGFYRPASGGGNNADTGWARASEGECDPFSVG